MTDNELIRVPVRTRASITHLGSLDSFDITAGGKKYHSTPNCSKMRSPVSIDLMEAIEKGYQPCGKCFK